MFEEQKKNKKLLSFFFSFVLQQSLVVTTHLRACCLVLTSNFGSKFFRLNSDFYKIAVRFMMVSTVNELG